MSAESVLDKETTTEEVAEVTKEEKQRKHVHKEVVQTTDAQKRVEAARPKALNKDRFPKYEPKKEPKK